MEMFDAVGKTADGLGASTAGAMAHEITEGNLYQDEQFKEKYGNKAFGYA